MGAESALPCSTAIFEASARVGLSGLGEAGLIRRNLRVFPIFGIGTSFTANNRRGARFQPCRVHVQPTFGICRVSLQSFLHAGMKACPHEVANGLIRIERRALDRFRLISCYTNLQRNRRSLDRLRGFGRPLGLGRLGGAWLFDRPVNLMSAVRLAHYPERSEP